MAASGIRLWVPAQVGHPAQKGSGAGKDQVNPLQYVLVFLQRKLLDFHAGCRDLEDFHGITRVNVSLTG